VILDCTEWPEIPQPHTDWGTWYGSECPAHCGGCWQRLALCTLMVQANTDGDVESNYSWKLHVCEWNAHMKQLTPPTACGNSVRGTLTSNYCRGRSRNIVWLSLFACLHQVLLFSLLTLLHVRCTCAYNIPIRIVWWLGLQIPIMGPIFPPNPVHPF